MIRWLCIALAIFQAAFGALGRATPACQFQSQPGLEYIGSGVDLASFLPRVGAVSEMKHFVVKLSCDKNTTWTNPYSKTTFAVWDQVESIRGDPSSVRDGVFFKFWDTFSFQEHFEESVSSGGLFGLFSASEEFDESFNLALKVNASLYFDFGKVNAFDVMLQSKLEPADGYLEAAGQLPFDWFLPTNWPQVESFVAQWGTHYIWQLSLGGEFRYASVCESVYLHTAGSAHADGQAALDFLFLLTADGGASGSASASETAYQAACVRSVSCIGGDQKSCNMNSTGNWTQYINSVDTTPGPGLTNAKYLFSPDLIASWHPKKAVAEAVSIAHIAWVGLEKLFAFYETTRAELARIAALPDPQCYVSTVSSVQDIFGVSATNYSCGTSPYKGSPDFRATSCSHMGSSGDPLPAVRNARAWAVWLLNQTAVHHSNMQATLASQNTSRKIDTWIHKVDAWTSSFKEMIIKVYSLPTLYTCSGTYDHTPTFCCTLCCDSHASGCSGSADTTFLRSSLEGRTEYKNLKAGDSCSKHCNGAPVGQPGYVPANLPPCHSETVLPNAMTATPPAMAFYV